MTESLKSEIMAAEQRRCAAMVANDGAALEALLDARLQFHHATGAVDDKTGYLAKLAGGRIVYLGIVWSEECLIPLTSNAAVLTGRMATDVEVDGAAKRLSNRVMTVWSRNAGAWQLAAFQSTPLAA